jgi:hypothetical protein
VYKGGKLDEGAWKQRAEKKRLSVDQIRVREREVFNRRLKETEQ